MCTMRNKTKLIRSYLLDELDKTLAIVGAIFSLFLTIWIKLVMDNFLLVMVGGLCFIMCSGYLMIRNFFNTSMIPDLDELRCSNRFYLTLNILFFLLLSSSIISIYLKTDYYVRPLWYFISTALMAVIVSNEILFLSSQKSHIYFSLCKIIIIGLSLQYSQILIFPSVVGMDPWWHQWFTLNIIENGHIPEGLAYSKLPIMQLMTGMTVLVTDLGYKMATMFSISSLQIISDALFVFLLGKFLINTKVGLLSALLLELSNGHIFFGVWGCPNTVGAVLILPIIFILFKLRKDKPFIGTSIAMFLMGVLILTHTLTAMFLTILFYTLWVGTDVYAILFPDEKTIKSVTLTLSVLFSIGMLAYWNYITGHIRNLSLLIKWGFSFNFLKGRLQYLFDIPFLDQIFNNLGMFLFFSLSFMGCFYLISKQFRNSNRFTLTFSGIVILCITFFSLIFNMDILVDRWFFFSQILLVIPLSLSLFLINSVSKNKMIKSLLISISVFILSFLLIMSSQANMDNRLLTPNSGFRFAFTESEMTALNTISRIWSGLLGVDFYGREPFLFDREFITIEKFLIAGNFDEIQDTLIVIREEILTHPYKIARGILDYDLHIVLEEQNFSRIYNDGSTSGYLKP